MSKTRGRSGVVVAGPGLYGGTNENVCDVDQLIEFLRENPDMALAWAEVQGLTVAELEDYLGGEMAGQLENTLVTNHGYRNGRRHRSADARRHRCSGR